MNSSEPAVSVSHPPFAVLRMVNPILSQVMRTPVGGSLRKRYLGLHFTGRRSGSVYDFPVRVHRHAGDVYAVTSNRWRLNFRGGAPVRTTYDGRTIDSRGELIESPDAVADLLLSLTEGYGKRAEHKLALKFTGTGSPTRDDFIEVVRDENLCAIRFTENG